MRTCEDFWDGKWGPNPHFVLRDSSLVVVIFFLCVLVLLPSVVGVLVRSLSSLNLLWFRLNHLVAYALVIFLSRGIHILCIERVDRLIPSPLGFVLAVPFLPLFFLRLSPLCSRSERQSAARAGVRAVQARAAVLSTSRRVQRRVQTALYASGGQRGRR